MNLLSLWQKSQPPPPQFGQRAYPKPYTHPPPTWNKYPPSAPCGYYIPKLSTFQKRLQLPEKKTCRGAQQKAGPQLTSVSSISSLPIAAGKAGKVKHCLHAWGAITSDLSILAMIEFGVTLDFTGLPPVFSPIVISFPSVNLPGIAEELLILGCNGVFIPTTLESGSFISPIFISPIFTTKKSDGSPRLILNLKKLNCYIRYVHFKMESLGDVLNIIKPGVWMALVDLQDAYDTIPVHPDHQKYLTFSRQHKYYKFTCLPNGYAQAPMIFTKLLKHPFSFLRRRGITLLFILMMHIYRVIHMMHATTMFMRQFLCFTNWGLP